MKRLSTWLKSLRPLKVLATGLVAILLFVSQACNAVSATKPDTTDKSEYYAPKDEKAKSPYEGGMNNFSDIDARAQDKDEVEAKAKALKEQAESNILNKGSINAAENARRVADDSGKLGKNIQRKAESVKDKLGEETESITDSAKQGLKNIKNNAQDAPGYAAETAERNIGNPVEGAKEGTRDAKNAVKRTYREADRNVDKSIDKAQDKAQDSIEDTSNGIQDKANQVVKSLQRNIDKAGDALKNVVD